MVKTIGNFPAIVLFSLILFSPVIFTAQTTECVDYQALIDFDAFNLAL